MSPRRNGQGEYRALRWIGRGLARCLALVPLGAWATALAAAVLLVASPRSHSQSDPLTKAAGLLDRDAQSQDEPIEVDASQVTHDRGRDEVTAEGDVVVTHGSTVLAADRVRLDRRNGEAEASGSVVIDDPQARLRATRIWLEIEDETGFLDDGDLYLPQTRFRIGGERMEKGIGQTYHIWDGTLTTCHCEEGPPSWSITGEEIDVSLEGYGTVRDGTFRIQDVPVLYLPWGVFPVRRTRQTGLLFPRFDFSSSRGFQWEQPFYWAIDKTSDATISLDVETAARLGVVGEYRYALAPDAGGIITASYFNEHIRGSTADAVVDPEQLADPTIPENRGSVIGYHQQPGPWGSRIYLRPFLVSDTQFLREINALTYVPSAGLLSTTQRYTTSRAGLVEVWDRGLFQGEATYYQDLIGKQSRVPQPLPRLTLQLRQPTLDGHLRLALNTEAVEYWRAPLASGPRLDFAPEARVPYRVGPYGYGTLRLVLRETAYYLTSNDVPIVPTPVPSPAVPLETRPVDRLQHREILQLTADFNTELSRVFEVRSGELRKVKHTIEPFLRYTYVPLVGQDDIPLWDSVDRINARNLITYGISSRLLGKLGSGLELDTQPLAPPPDGSNELIGEPYGPPPPPRIAPEEGARIQELARLYVQQGYEISHPVFLSADKTKRVHFSGVDAGLRVTPTSFFGLQGRMTFSPTDRRLLYADAGINVFDPRPVAGEDDLSLADLRPANTASLFYQFNSGGAVENVNFAATYRVTDDVALAYLGRFDALATRFLENWAGFRLISQCDCWVLDFAFIDRVNPDEREYRVLFSLVGLGSFGQQPFAAPRGGFGAPAAGLGTGGIY